MSFFPTADPEKLRANMAQEQAYYQMATTPSPSQHSHAADDDFDGSTWVTTAASSQNHYAMSQASAWPSQPHGLGLESLPTPTQSMFDQAYSSGSGYDISSSWAQSAGNVSTSSTFPTFTTTQTPAMYPSYSFATPVAPTVAWDENTASFAASYDSPPARSDYSTSSAQSLVESSPYAYSDGCFPSGRTPSIKTEDAMEYQRPRLYSVPGLVSSSAQVLHVNPGDVYSSPPLTATDQQMTETFQVPKAEEPDSKHFLRPQRPQTRRAVSEDVTNRQKRGYTTQANMTCQCKLCGKPFQRHYNLKAHMDTHDPDRAHPHSCHFGGCNRSFVRRTDLVRHQQSVHLKTRNHQCRLCFSTFARKDTLHRHQEDGCPKRAEIKRRISPEYLPSRARRSSQHQHQHPQQHFNNFFTSRLEQFS